MTLAGPKLIGVEDRSGISIITFRQPRLLDEMTIRDVARELLAVLERKPLAMVVTFRDLEYLASTMLGKLITLQRKARERRIPLALAQMPGRILDVFKISNLETYFEIHPNIDDAIAACAAPGASSTPGP